MLNFLFTRQFSYDELEKTGNASSYIIFQRTVERWPDREGFVFEGRSWTYAQAERQIDKLVRER